MASQECRFLPSSVVLKQWPLGSLRYFFSFLGVNLFQGGSGEEKQWVKTLNFWFVYSTHKKNFTARLVYSRGYQLFCCKETNQNLQVC